MTLPEGMIASKELERVIDSLARFTCRQIVEQVVKMMHDTGIDDHMTVHTFAMNLLLVQMGYMERFAFHSKFHINKTMYQTMHPRMRDLIENDPEFQKAIDKHYDELLDDLNKHDKPRD